MDGGNSGSELVIVAVELERFKDGLCFLLPVHEHVQLLLRHPHAHLYQLELDRGAVVEVDLCYTLFRFVSYSLYLQLRLSFEVSNHELVLLLNHTTLSL